MSSPNLVEQLDYAIDHLMAQPDSMFPELDSEIVELASIARELRCIPRTEFKTRLKSELDHQAATMRAKAHTTDADAVLPSLFGLGYNNFPVHRANFAASFLLHAAAMALILTSGLWMVQHRNEVTHQVVTMLTEPSPYALPPAPDKSGGGGGGGDRDKFAASKGTLPKFAREQLTPPAVVIRNNDPKLSAAPTVIGPPSVTFPQSAQLGNPLSAVLGPLSNGPGFGGGIGSGSGTGIGSGRGPGVGPGIGGGIGGGVFRVGGGVSAPRALYDPDPDYSEEARKAKYQGVVVLWVIIGPDGRPRDVHVQRSLGMGLDQKAIEAVRRWKFEPAMKDGQPVAVQVSIEVNFHLY